MAEPVRLQGWDERLRLGVQHRPGQEHEQDDGQQHESAEVSDRRELPEHREEGQHADRPGDRRELVHVAHGTASTASPRIAIDTACSSEPEDGERHTSPAGPIGEGAPGRPARSCRWRGRDGGPSHADEDARFGGHGGRDPTLAAERVLGGVAHRGQRVDGDRRREEGVRQVGHRAVDTGHASLPSRPGSSSCCAGLLRRRCSRLEQCRELRGEVPESLRARPPTETTVSDSSRRRTGRRGQPEPDPAPTHAQRADQPDDHRDAPTSSSQPCAGSCDTWIDAHGTQPSKRTVTPSAKASGLADRAGSSHRSASSSRRVQRCRPTAAAPLSFRSPSVHEARRAPGG